MVNSSNQIERNVSASFGYVKKDIMMLNDVISDLNDKIQHLSLNHASLLEKMQRIESEVVKTERKEAKFERKVKKTTKKTVNKKTKKKTSKKTTRKPSKIITTEEVVY